MFWNLGVVATIRRINDDVRDHPDESSWSDYTRPRSHSPCTPASELAAAHSDKMSIAHRAAFSTSANNHSSSRGRRSAEIGVTSDRLSPQSTTSSHHGRS